MDMTRRSIIRLLATLPLVSMIPWAKAARRRYPVCGQWAEPRIDIRKSNGRSYSVALLHHSAGPNEIVVDVDGKLMGLTTNCVDTGHYALLQVPTRSYRQVALNDA
jgi:hypothetical protein